LTAAGGAAAADEAGLGGADAAEEEELVLVVVLVFPGTNVLESGFNGLDVFSFAMVDILYGKEKDR
jgi:hypothetical protein